jgi:hypothetical protein
MKNFVQWLESISSVSINYKTFVSEMQEASKKIIASMHDRNEKARSFQPNQFLQQIQQAATGYPDLANLMKALQSKNQRWILDQQYKLRNWISSQYVSQGYNQTANLRTLSRDIFTYVDFLSNDQDVDESSVNNLVKVAVKDTVKICL